MRSTQEVLSFIAEANPVPDADTSTIPQIDSGAYLVALGRRADSATDPDRPLRLGVVAVAAAVIIVVALSALVLLLNSEPEVVAPDPESIITEFVTATDITNLENTLTEAGMLNYRDASRPATADGVDARVIANGFEANRILGAVYTVEGCEEPLPGIFRCTITFRSHITEAFGEDPSEEIYTFYVEDGKITTGSQEFGMDIRARGVFEFGVFAKEAGLEEALLEACPNIRDMVPSCAHFMMDQLDDWVAWARANGQDR